MLTHKQVKKLNAKLIKDCVNDMDNDHNYVPIVMKARSNKDASLIAIHLLNPTMREIEDAVEHAINNWFPKVMIHTKRTFRGGK